jgi:acetoin utilization deacetylase AcuC-like enzyme
MRVSHHPHYALRLPEGHPFPMSKYTLVRQRLIERGTLAAEQIVEPDEVERAVLERVHSSAYLDKLAAGSLSAQEQRRLGVPWSAALWRRARLAVQGTLDAARRALYEGVSGNLAGGTHHAFADHGEGFCVLNDVAVAIRALQAEGAIARALIVDLDVHQGNGTAAIFAADPRVFTFSMHGARNYPLEKLKSTLDVELADGTGDAEYLALLAEQLERILAGFQPNVVFYLAGVDVAAGDRYGRLALTDAGIRARDRYVVRTARSRSLPLVLTMAGGYAASPERTAELHAIAYEEAAA